MTLFSVTVVTEPGYGFSGPYCKIFIGHVRSSKPIRNRYRQEGSSNINYTRPSENSRHVVIKYRKPVYNDFEYTITNIRRNLSLGQNDMQC